MANIKEKLNECFSSALYYRELGVDLKHKEKYDRCLKFFDQSLRADPENCHAIQERSNARAYAMKFDEAEEDIEKLLKLNPNIYGFAEKAFITYLKCEFEQALIQNHRNKIWRQKPENFMKGVQICEYAILNSISEDAGRPLRDFYTIIRKLAWYRAIEGQRVPVPKPRNKQEIQKPIVKTLPMSSDRNRKEQQKKKKIHAEELERKSSHQRRTSFGSVGKFLSVSIALINEGSSISDSIQSHTSSLQNIIIPPGPKFPHKPIQRYASNIENYLAEKYLDKVYLDKKFLKNIVVTSGFLIENEKGGKKLTDLATQGYQDIHQVQEMLRTRKPFYYLRYKEGKSSPKLAKRKSDIIQGLRVMTLKKVNFLMKTLEEAVHSHEINNFQQVADKFIHFSESTSRKLFPTRSSYISNMVILLCHGFYESKKFSKNMTRKQEEIAVKTLLGIPTESFSSKDSNSFYVDWKKRDVEYRKRLYKVNGADQLTWIYHELARINIELKNYELARVYARRCITEANVYKNLYWILNAMVLIAKIDIFQRNKNDAIKQIKHAKCVAIRLADDDMIKLLERCLVIIDICEIDGQLGLKLLITRQDNIINFLTTKKMKDEANIMFRKNATLPVSQRFSVLPGFRFDMITEDKICGKVVPGKDDVDNPVPVVPTRIEGKPGVIFRDSK